MQSRIRVFQWLAVLGVVCGGFGAAQAQTSVDDVSARLVGKIFFLRGDWNEKNLKFDADGQPLKHYKVASFTESGIRVTSVKMKGQNLRIEGERDALLFDPDGVASFARVPDNNFKIEIAGSADFSKAIDAIFAADAASLIPSLPDYWQPYARKNFLPAGIVPRKAGAGEKSPTAGHPEKNAMHVGGSVKPPRLLHNAEPSFTQVARGLKYSANVQVYLWVDENGLPTHFRVARPAGAGLDDEAIETVRNYKFAPATENGKPVKVEIYVDVNFRIF